MNRCREQPGFCWLIIGKGDDFGQRWRKKPGFFSGLGRLPRFLGDPLVAKGTDIRYLLR